MSTLKLDASDIAMIQPEIGETYPLFGLITGIISESPEQMVVELNHNIHLSMPTDQKEHFELIRSRMLETGIFVVEITSRTEDIIYAEAKLVILSKHRPEQH